MKSYFFKFLILGIFLTGNSGYAQELLASATPLIVAKQQDNEVVLEKIFIEEGETKVITDPSIITIILPVGLGTAGSVIKASEKGNMIIVRNRNNHFEITFRSISGEEKEYAQSASFSDLKTVQIRVNITRGDGYKQAYMIYNYKVIKKDEGPVLDMFGGAIPLEVNDYSFTIATKKNTKPKSITGSVLYKNIDGWIVVEGKLPNGTIGNFIIDTGASGGIVLKQNALPDNTEISKLKAVAYSDKGQTETKGKMQTADGSVEDNNFLGVTKISSFDFGNITLNDQQISVLKEFPEFLEKHNIIGIIGINILKQAEIVRIENINKDHGEITFLNKENYLSTSNDYCFPFTTASNLLFIKGNIHNTSIDFLMDTGARRSIISSSLVDDNNLRYNTLNTTKTTGLGGKETDSINGSFENVMIENKLFNDFHFLISSNLNATKAMGLENSGALLGMNFFRKFRAMELNFITNKLYLIN